MLRVRVTVDVIEPKRKNKVDGSKSLFSHAPNSTHRPGAETSPIVRPGEALTLRRAGLGADVIRKHMGVLLRSPGEDERLPPVRLCEEYSKPFSPALFRTKHPNEVMEEIFPNGGWLSVLREDDTFLLVDLKRTKGCLTDIDNLTRVYQIEVCLVDGSNTPISPGSPVRLKFTHTAVASGWRTKMLRFNRCYDPSVGWGRPRKPSICVVWENKSALFGEKVDLGGKSVAVAGGSASGPKYKGCTDGREIIKDFGAIGIAISESNLPHVIKILTEDPPPDDPPSDGEDSGDDDSDDSDPDEEQPPPPVAHPPAAPPPA